MEFVYNHKAFCHIRTLLTNIRNIFQYQYPLIMSSALLRFFRKTIVIHIETDMTEIYTIPVPVPTI